MEELFCVIWSWHRFIFSTFVSTYIINKCKSRIVYSTQMSRSQTKTRNVLNVSVCREINNSITVTTSVMAHWILRWSLVHTSDVSVRTRSIRKQCKTSLLGLAKIKEQESFLSFVFCSVFGLCLEYDLTLTLATILMSKAWLHSSALPFVLTLYLCSSMN